MNIFKGPVFMILNKNHEYKRPARGSATFFVTTSDSTLQTPLLTYLASPLPTYLLPICKFVQRAVQRPRQGSVTNTARHVTTPAGHSTGNDDGGAAQQTPEGTDVARSPPMLLLPSCSFAALVLAALAFFALRLSRFDAF